MYICHFYYKKKGEKFIAALGFDSMVKKEYRDFFTFYETERACWPCLRGIGCKLLFGFPNDESYPVMIKGFKVKDIGRFDHLYPSDQDWSDHSEDEMA